MHNMTSRQLSAFAIDIQYYLEQTGFLRHLRTVKTGDQECAIRLIFDVLDKTIQAREILREIHRVWSESSLGYGKDELSDEAAASFVKLKFKTASLNNELAATGEILVNLED